MNALIMLVDDNTAFRDTLQELLELENFQTLVAASVPEALSILNTSPVCPQIIISDLLLGDTNGFDLADALLAQAQWQAIKIIFLSGSSDPQLEERQASLPNVRALLHKPLINRQVLEMIEQVLKQG